MKNCESCIMHYDDGGELFGSNPHYECNPTPDNLDEIADGECECPLWAGPRQWSRYISRAEWQRKISRPLR